MGRVRIEVIALVGVLLGKTDDVEQVLSNLFGVRRRLPFVTPALTRWARGAVNVYRPYRDRVSGRSMIRMIRTIGIERIRNIQIADLATARNLVVEVCAASLSAKRAIEPARAAAVRTAVGHWILYCRLPRIAAHSQRQTPSRPGCIRASSPGDLGAGLLRTCRTPAQAYTCLCLLASVLKPRPTRGCRRRSFRGRPSGGSCGPGTGTSASCGRCPAGAA